MGAASSLFRSKIEFGAELGIKEDGSKDMRRRNSLAFNIAEFVQYEKEEYADLVEEVRAMKKGKGGSKSTAVRHSKFSKIAEAVLQGNMKELRNQTVVYFNFINRKYQDHHGGNTLLHFACQEGYYKMITFMADPHNHTELDENELEITIRNDRFRTPLMLCFTPPSATYLGQKYGVAPDGNPYTEMPEELEAEADWVKPGGPRTREQCIKFLIQHGADVNDPDFHNFTCLHYAAMWGWTSTARILLDAGADINAMNQAGKTPLMLAVELLHDSMVTMLCSHENIALDAVDADGHTALVIAVEQHGQLLDDSEREREDPAKNDANSSSAAARGPDLNVEKAELTMEIVQILLKAGANPNIVTIRRKSALKFACQSQQLSMINTLLDYKCERRQSCFNLLSDELMSKVQTRLAEDARREAAEAARLEKEAKAREKEMMFHGGKGSNRKSPYGAWVEYRDKRSGNPFYYNTVTRQSTKEKPADFKAKKNRVIKEATFGMSFYH